MINSLLAIALLFLLGGGKPITEQNWRQHPAIREIRAINDRVQHMRHQGRLKEEVREFGNCINGDEVRKISVDEDSVARIYYFETGSEHWAMEIEVCFDWNGVRRLVSIDASAVNGTIKSYRKYFAATGEMIWEKDTLLKGEGYTFPDPNEFLPTDARKAFNAENPCQE
jgi:hypothetical protein